MASYDFSIGVKAVAIAAGGGTSSGRITITYDIRTFADPLTPAEDIEVRFFLSEDAILDGGDSLLGEVSEGLSQAPFSTDAKTALFDLPADLAEGAYRIFAQLDPTDSYGDTFPVDNTDDLAFAYSRPAAPPATGGSDTEDTTPKTERDPDPDTTSDKTPEDTPETGGPIKGTRGPDRLTGTKGDDRIKGGAGDDRLKGKAGDNLN